MSRLVFKYAKSHKMSRFWCQLIDQLLWPINLCYMVIMLFKSPVMPNWLSTSENETIFQTLYTSIAKLKMNDLMSMYCEVLISIKQWFTIYNVPFNGQN